MSIPASDLATTTLTLSSLSLAYPSSSTSSDGYSLYNFTSIIFCTPDFFLSSQTAGLKKSCMKAACLGAARRGIVFSKLWNFWGSC